MGTQLYKILETQTHQVRIEIEALQNRLDLISGKLDQYSTEEESICRKLDQVSSGQRSFQERIDETAEKLNYCKSLLASFQA